MAVHARASFLLEIASARALVLLAAVFLLPGSQCGSDAPFAPRPGLDPYRALTRVAVPGGVVDVAGGSLHLERVDLSLDTRLGPYALAVRYDSVTRAWRFGFEMTFDGVVFTDPTGAVHTTDGLAPGDAIPGTHWVYEGPAALRTKGGLRHEFVGGLLDGIRWQGSAYPRVRMVRAFGQLLAIDQCIAADGCEALFQLTMDRASGRPSRVVDRAGRVASYEYDAAGRVVVARDAVENELGIPGTRYTWSPASMVVAVETSDGQRTEYAHQGGRLIAATAVGEESPRWSFAYRGASGRALYQSTVTSPSGARSAYFYDDDGQLYRRRDEQTGDEIHLEWQQRRPVRRIDPAGAETRWFYVNDDVALIATASGNLVLIDYEPGARNASDALASPVRWIRDTLGTIEERGYDTAGRLAWVDDGAADRTHYAYDALGQLESVTSPLGVTTTYKQYGSHGHPGRRKVGGVAVDFEYDEVGNLTHGPGGEGPSSPALGGILRRRFDANRRVVEVKLASLSGPSTGTVRTLEVERRADGQPLAIRRPHGGDWEYVYDALGRPTARWERVSGVWYAMRFEYDSAGRPRARELANGMRTEWEYDATGRLRATRLVGGEGAEALYDYQAGRLAALHDSHFAAPEQYTRDLAGRVVEVRYPHGEWEERQYDVRSRLVARRLRRTDGTLLTQIAREYDGADRLTRIFARGVLVLEQSYAAGREEATRSGNGLTRTASYDPTFGYVSGHETRDGGGSLVERSTISWDLSLFYVDASTHTTGGVNATRSERHFLGPLWGPGQPGPRVWSSDALVFDYDALSNLKRAGNASFDYNAEHNRLEAIQGGGRSHSYAYDAAGYAVERDGEAVAWDAAGRIRQVGVDAFFDWDVSGRPLARRRGGEVELYRFGGAVRADADLEPTALDLGAVEIRFDTGERFYRHHDYRGNVKFVTDDAGAVRVHYDYGAYGVEWAGASAEVDGEFAQGEAVTDGLVVLGTRLYEPDAGRFLSPDPAPQLVNQYAYAMGNPVQLWDPSGRELTAKDAYFTAVAWGGTLVGGSVSGGSLVAIGLGAGVALVIGNFVYQGVTGDRGITWHEVPKAMFGIVDVPEYSRDGAAVHERGGPGTEGRAGPTSAAPPAGGGSPSPSGEQVRVLDLSVLSAIDPLACTGGHSFSGGLSVEVLSPFGPLRVVGAGALGALWMPLSVLLLSRLLVGRSARR